MTNIATPKIFISYSWTTPEHQSWVIDLAETLVQNGVDVVLDKWELREGDDSHAFMERMVNDSSVTHIIMVIDGKYTERANDRSGGVGTESTILSNELYTQKGKNNIVAVLAEPNVKKPTFYASRIHVDLSDEDKYAEELEKLIRWAFGKYKYEKPVLGTAPSFILAEETGIVLNTNLEYKFALDALQKGKTNSNNTVKKYLDKFRWELKKYDFDSTNPVESFHKNLESFKTYLSEFKKLLSEVCYSENEKIHYHYRQFFEELLVYQTVEPNGQSKLIAELEFYRFITWVMFLHYVAFTIKSESFDHLKTILEEIYEVPKNFRSSNSEKYRNFLIFKCYSDSFIENLYNQKKYSPIGHLLQDICDNEYVTFEELCEADLLIYLKSIISALESSSYSLIWWPHAGFYVLDGLHPLKIFAKSEKTSYFSEVKKILNISDLSFVEDAISKNDSNGWGTRYIPNWNGSFNSLNLKVLTNYEKLKKK